MDQNDYKTTGSWENDEISLDFYIPEEDPQNPYILHPLYNISRNIIYNGTELLVNAVLIFLKKRKDEGFILSSTEPKYHQVFNIGDFTNYSSMNTVELDPELELFVIVYHDNTFNQEHVNYFFEKMPDFYSHAAKMPYLNYATDIPAKEWGPIRPKRAGMSILRKQ